MLGHGGPLQHDRAWDGHRARKLIRDRTLTLTATNTKYYDICTKLLLPSGVTNPTIRRRTTLQRHPSYSTIRSELKLYECALHY